MYDQGWVYSNHLHLLHECKLMFNNFLISNCPSNWSRLLIASISSSISISFTLFLLHPFGSLLLFEISTNLIFTIKNCFTLYIVSLSPSGIDVYQYFALLTGFQNIASYTISPAYTYSGGLYPFITISSCAVYTIELHSTM